MSLFWHKAAASAVPPTFETMGVETLEAARTEGASAAAVDSVGIEAAATASLAAMRDKLHAFFTPEYFRDKPFAVVAARFSYDPATRDQWTEEVAKTVAEIINRDHARNGYANAVLTTEYAGGQGPWTVHFGATPGALASVPNDIANRIGSVSDWPWS